MSQTIISLLAIVPSATCAAAAFYLAAHGLSGWGWFLLVCAITAGVEFKGSK